MTNNQEQYELEVILQNLTEAKTDLERLVKEYTKARLKSLQDRSQARCSPHKGHSHGLKVRKGRKTPEGGSKW